MADKKNSPAKRGEKKVSPTTFRGDVRRIHWTKPDVLREGYLAVFGVSAVVFTLVWGTDLFCSSVLSIVQHALGG